MREVRGADGRDGLRAYLVEVAREGFVVEVRQRVGHRSAMV